MVALSVHQSIIPDERLIGALRCRTSESGFRNVYRHRVDENGNAVYVACIKRGGLKRKLPGSDSTSPHICAVHVARWYLAEFGPEWRSVLAARKVNPFEVRYSKVFRGYYAVAYIMGERVSVEKLVRLPRRFGRDRWRPLAGQIAVFSSRQEAKQNMRLYLTRLYGVLAPCLLWRPAPVVQQHRAAA